MTTMLEALSSALSPLGIEINEDTPQAGLRTAIGKLYIRMLEREVEHLERVGAYQSLLIELLGHGEARSIAEEAHDAELEDRRGNGHLH